MDRESNKDFYNSFIETMQFLFPSHKINNQFLYYYGNNSYYEVDDNGNVVNDLHKVNDYYNKIINDGLISATKLNKLTVTTLPI